MVNTAPNRTKAPRTATEPVKKAEEPGKTGKRTPTEYEKVKRNLMFYKARRQGSFSMLLLSVPLASVLGTDGVGFRLPGGGAEHVTVRDDADAAALAVRLCCALEEGTPAADVVGVLTAGAGTPREKVASSVVEFYLLREVCLWWQRGLMSYLNDSATEDHLEKALGPVNARNKVLTDVRAAVAQGMPDGLTSGHFLVPTAVMRELFTVVTGALKTAATTQLARSVAVAARTAAQGLPPRKRHAVRALADTAAGVGRGVADAARMVGAELAPENDVMDGGDDAGEGVDSTQDGATRASSPAPGGADTTVSRAGAVRWSRGDLDARLEWVAVVAGIKGSNGKSARASIEAEATALRNALTRTNGAWNAECAQRLVGMEELRAAHDRQRLLKPTTSFTALDAFVSLSALQGGLAAALVKNIRSNADSTCTVRTMMKVAGFDDAQMDEVHDRLKLSLMWLARGVTVSKLAGNHYAILKGFQDAGKPVRAGLPASFVMTGRFVDKWGRLKTVMRPAHKALGINGRKLEGDGWIAQDRQWSSVMPGLFWSDAGAKSKPARRRMGARRVLVSARDADVLGVKGCFAFCVTASGVDAHVVTATYFEDGFTNKADCCADIFACRDAAHAHCGRKRKQHAGMMGMAGVRAALAARGVCDARPADHHAPNQAHQRRAVGAVWAPALATAVAACAKKEAAGADVAVTDPLAVLGLGKDNVMYVGVDPGRKDLATVTGFTIDGAGVVVVRFSFSVSSRAFRQHSGTGRATRAAAAFMRKPGAQAAQRAATEAAAVLANSEATEGQRLLAHTSRSRARAELKRLQCGDAPSARARSARWGQERSYCDFIADEIIRRCAENGGRFPLVVYGAANFAPQQRGLAIAGGGTTAPRQLRRHLEKRFLVVLMSEMYTSTACPWCQHRVERVPGLSDRWWRCGRAGCEGAAPFHKDVTAAIFMGRLFHEYVRTAVASEDNRPKRPPIMTSLRRDVERAAGAAG